MTEPINEPAPVDPGHDPGVDPPPDEETSGPEADADADGEGRTYQEALDRVDMVDEQEPSTIPLSEQGDPVDRAEKLDDPDDEDLVPMTLATAEDLEDLGGATQPGGAES
ncbi:MAG: hypothetical protein QM747_18265 [Nocardioides sp.]